MGDEFSDGIDDLGSDMEMTDIGPEPAMDIPEDIPMDIPEDVPMDIPEDVPMDMPEDIPMDMPEDIPMDVPEDIPAEIPEDIPEYTSSDTLEQGYIDSPVNDLGMADPAALEGYDQAEVFEEELSESEPEILEEDVTVDIPHDLPEDIPEDVPEDIPEDVPEDIPEDVPEDIPEDVPSDIPEEVPSDVPPESDRPALDAMSQYMIDHNYDQSDAAEYMNDPEWQELNRNLQAEDGIERSPQQDMQEYMVEHNYGRDDAAEYRNDPEWQEINNAYLESQGQEPIEYPETSHDIPEDIPSDVPEDIPSDVPEDIPEDIPEDVPEDIPEDIPEDVPEDIPEDVPTDIPQDVPSDIPQDIPEEIPSEQTAQEAMHEYMEDHGYTMEDMEEFTKDPEWQELNRDQWSEFGAQYEQTGDTPEDIPSDVPGDMPEEIPSDVPSGMPEEIPSDVPSDMPEEIPSDVPTDIPEDIPSDVPSDMPEERPALNAMSEYLSEHNYGLEDADEYRQDPEWQQLNRDLMIESGLDPDSMEEVVPGPEEITPEEIPSAPEEIPSGPEEIPPEEVISGPENVTPGPVEITPEPVERIDGVAQELERGDFETMVELEAPDFYTNGEFLEQAVNEYGFEGTCGETTQANTLNKLFETNQFTENNVLDVAVQNDLCEISLDPAESGGTTTDQFMELYEKMDEQLGGGKIEAECYEFDDVLPMMEIANQLDEGKIVNVAVDSGRLWDMPQDYVDQLGNPVDEIASDHWIAVTGVNRDAAGNLQSFDILDSGGGETNVSADKFGEMVYGSGYHKVIDPTVIVVSKKA